MPHRLGRRALLGSAALACAVPLLAPSARGQAAVQALRYGPPQPFDFDRLTQRARELAGQPYTPPPRPDPAVVARIDYDAYGQIRFRPDLALFADGSGAFPITFKLVGQFFPKTVRMHRVEEGQAREILYSPDYFTMPDDSPARALAAEPSAFAGFWVEESRLSGDWTKEEPWVTFLGASYWRAKGELGQVGLSSRGVSINTGQTEPEEFPDFTAHWFEPAATDADAVVVHSLMEGPSITGAFRFKLYRGKGVIMEVENRLFLRRDIAHFGVAPLTSMFWYAENEKRYQEDWRPEVHDSDGLGMWTGASERIWRPLDNPRRIVTSSFVDRDPKGFGLAQRDRDFENYLDGVRYERRPSVWVEPVGAWGEGAVRLVEIPTDDEIYDNINALWSPAAPAVAGAEFAFAYHQHWLADEPYPAEELARATATRIGRGGQPGKPRPPGLRKLVVEFAGPALEALPESVAPEAVAWASQGEISQVVTERVPNTSRWRAMFDLQEPDGATVDLRLYLKAGDRTLSETWIYQVHREDGR